MCFISHLSLRILYNPLGTHAVIIRWIQPKLPVRIEIDGKVGRQTEEVIRTPK